MRDAHVETITRLCWGVPPQLKARKVYKRIHEEGKFKAIVSRNDDYTNFTFVLSAEATGSITNKSLIEFVMRSEGTCTHPIFPNGKDLFLSFSKELADFVASFSEALSREPVVNLAAGVNPPGELEFLRKRVEIFAKVFPGLDLYKLSNEALQEALHPLTSNALDQGDRHER